MFWWWTCHSGAPSTAKSCAAVADAVYPPRVLRATARRSHACEARFPYTGTLTILTSHLNTHSRFSACFGGGLVTPEPRLRRNPALLSQMPSTPLEFSERLRGDRMRVKRAFPTRALLQS